MKVPAADTPRELPPGTWEPPPVRRGSSESPPPPPPGTEAPAASTSDTTQQIKRRRSVWFGSALLLGLLILVGSVAAVWYVRAMETEDRQFALAQQEFAEAKFLSAGRRFRKLESNFPDSPRLAEYRFFAELSEVRRRVHDVPPQPDEALSQLESMLKQRSRTDPLLRQHQKLVSDTLAKLAPDLTASAQRWLKPPPNLANARQMRDLAQRALALFRGLAPRDTDPALMEKIDQSIQELGQAIAREEKADALLREFSRRPLLPGDTEALEDTARKEGLDGHPRIRDELGRRRGMMRDAVRYQKAEQKLLPPPVENSDPSLLIVPRLAGSVGKPEGGVVFALARGVLYALAEGNGQVLWATRVGIDTANLPVRLPAQAATPEVALVLSSDTNTLTARDTRTGRALWSHSLRAPCLGRPLIVDQRAYVPTVDGKVHEIEIIGGNLLGWYTLGLPLSTGGAREEGTGYLYFPADRRFVFVLEGDPRRRQEGKACVAVLQSRHPSGSLRGEPIIVSWQGLPGEGNVAPRRRHLILSQTDGLGHMKLRAYRLPIEDPDAPLQAEVRVRGWSWFSPHFDPEKITLITDAGVLGLFGINQPHNQDAPLFPLLPEEFALQGREQPGRAQVVHAEDRDFWALTQGELHHLQLVLNRQAGLQVLRNWTAPAPLGSPLHAGQVNERRDTLFVVTQAPGRPTCLATAVDSATGQVRWQRQLGLLCQGEPVVVGDRVLALDQSGALFQFNPAQHPQQAESEWQIAGQVVAPPPVEAPRSPPILLPAPDGRSVYEVCGLGKGDRLLLRRYQPDRDIASREIALSSPLVGTPALTADHLVLPCADGMVHRLSLDGKREETSRNWRNRGADADALGHVLHLGGDRFLVTDGSRGLFRLDWPLNQVWQAKPLTDLPMRRIVAAPVLLPAGDAGLRVCVADAEGTLTLLEGEALKVARRWSLGGTITAGPFVRGPRIGCVVDRQQLVWIDPDREELLWKYTTQGESIVGQPQLMEAMVVVADMGGRFVALDPASGKPRGRGQTLTGSVAPAAAPVPFGPGRAFAPLTDGTVLLLSLKGLTRE